MQGAGRPRLEALDGLRGVAALAVVFCHAGLQPFLGARPYATHAYLAVDLFFMISGFVLAHAYGDQLRRGRGLEAFLRGRLVRLLPLYALGAGLGFIVLLLTGSQGRGAAELGLLVLLAGCFLPRVAGGAAGEDAFPLNPPSWSLSLELWGNLAYGAFARRLGPRTLACVLVLSAVVLAQIAVLGGGLNYGWRQGDAWLGWPRFIFAFSAGLMLHRLWTAGRLRAPQLPDWAPAAALALVLTAPGGGALNPVLDLLILLAVFPLLLALSLAARPSARCSAPLGFAARLSYPLYAVHAAVIAAVQAAARALGAPAAGGAVLGVFALTASLAAAWAAQRWFDRPARDWLRRLAGPGTAPAPRSAA